jgi:DNA replication initiation complex subunit (GINS family)
MSRLLKKLKNADSLNEIDEDLSSMEDIFDLQKMFEIHSQEKDIEEKLKNMGYIN